VGASFRDSGRSFAGEARSSCQSLLQSTTTTSYPQYHQITTLVSVQVTDQPTCLDSPRKFTKPHSPPLSPTTHPIETSECNKKHQPIPSTTGFHQCSSERNPTSAMNSFFSSSIFLLSYDFNHITTIELRVGKKKKGKKLRSMGCFCSRSVLNVESRGRLFEVVYIGAEVSRFAVYGFGNWLDAGLQGRVQYRYRGTGITVYSTCHTLKHPVWLSVGSYVNF